VIIAMRWSEVAGGMRVILSTGRIVHVLDRVPGLPGVAMLRNAHGRTASATVDPGAVVPVVFDEQDVALAHLKTRFTRVEFIRELES
jgi:hypothetical protein